MSFCSSCGNKIAAVDRFCGKCGTPISGTSTKSITERTAFKEPRQFRPGGRTTEGQQAIKKIKDKKLNNLLIFLGFSLVAFLAIGVYGYIETQDTHFVLPLTITSIILCSIIGSYINRFSKKNYYTLPGTRDESGNHRCFFCGNKGVYKHTPYKTNQTLADCSKCGERLWVE